jgi:hypothetical protein
LRRTCSLAKIVPMLSGLLAMAVLTTPSAIHAATYASLYGNMSTPEYTNSGDQNVIISGRIQPAAAGRTISLYTVNSDGTTTYVQGTITDAAGDFILTTNVQIITDFRLFSVKQIVGADTYSAASYPSATEYFTVKSLRFWDPMDHSSWASMDTKWDLRQTSYGVAGRTLMRADASALGFPGNGTVTLKVIPDPGDSSKHLVGHVTTGTLNFVRGHLEARVKLHRPGGAHSAFWHQSGYGVGAAETDVVEFFGERSPNWTNRTQVDTQKVQHTIHVGNSSGGTTQFPRFSWTSDKPSGASGSNHTANLFPGNDSTWWNNYHTYEVFWNTGGYTCYIDGTNVGTISPSGSGLNTTGGATLPGELILSMLVNDGSEYNEMMDNINLGRVTYSEYTMSVDWVRAWR